MSTILRTLRSTVHRLLFDVSLYWSSLADGPSDTETMACTELTAAISGMERLEEACIINGLDRLNWDVVPRGDVVARTLKRFAMGDTYLGPGVVDVINGMRALETFVVECVETAGDGDLLEGVFRTGSGVSGHAGHLSLKAVTITMQPHPGMMRGIGARIKGNLLDFATTPNLFHLGSPSDSPRIEDSYTSSQTSTKYPLAAFGRIDGFSKQPRTAISGNPDTGGGN